MSFFSVSNNTVDFSSDTMLFRCVRDEDGSWLFSDDETNVWGSGRTLLEAMCDYWSALASHISVLADRPLVPRLERELKVMRSRREVQAPSPETDER